MVTADGRRNQLLCCAVRARRGRPQELRLILRGLVVGLRSVSNIMMLLVLVIYIYSVLGVTMFADNDPVHFATVRARFVPIDRSKPPRRTAADRRWPFVPVPRVGERPPYPDGHDTTHHRRRSLSRRGLPNP